MSAQIQMRDHRAWWITALEAAAEIGELAAAGGELSKEHAFTLAGVAVRATTTPFPLPYASAASAANGFRALARGFSAAADPQLKAELARATAAAARCCLRLLEIETEQQAAHQRRRYGED